MIDHYDIFDKLNIEITPTRIINRCDNVQIKIKLHDKILAYLYINKIYQIMKTLFTILFTALLSLTAAAQVNCSPKVTVNCDSTLSIDALPKLSNFGVPPDGYLIIFDGLNAPSNTIIPYPIGGGNVLYTTTTSISPSYSQYSVTVAVIDNLSAPIGVGYPCNSTSIVNSAYDPTTNSYIGVPALIGYQYQYGAPAVQIYTCPTASANRFIKIKKGRKK